MINNVIELIRIEVNDFIGRKFKDTTVKNRVVLSSFVDEAGKVAIPEDTVGLSLLNIEEEKSLKRAGMVRSNSGERHTDYVYPPISLNLQIMFAAYFNEYGESLKHISYIMGCLQNKPVFDKDNTPGIETIGTSKLMFELNTLPLQEQHYIWSMIGLRYIPSIVYRVRMLAVFEGDVAAQVVNVGEISVSAGLKEVND